MTDKRRKFSEADKAEAKRLYLLNEPTASIAKKIGCTPRAINLWVKQNDWHVELQSRIKNPEKLEENINHLLEQPSSYMRDKQIRMLTNSLKTLQTITPKPNPRPQIQHELQQDLIARIEESGWLRAYQQTVFYSTARFRIILKSRQIGFSDEIALEILTAAASGRNQVVVSASEVQAGIVLNYIINHCNRYEVAYGAIPIKKANGIQIIGGGYIIVGSTNSSSIQGHAADIWMDECAWNKRAEENYRVLFPSITTIKGRVTLISTPFTKGSFFYRVWVNQNNEFPNFERHKITIEDARQNGFDIDDEEMDILRSGLDSESWQMFYMCEWAEDGTALISWKLLESIATVEECRLWDKPVYVGVDVGGISGRRDRTVISVTGETGDENKPYRLLHYEVGKTTTPDERLAFIASVFQRYHVKQLNVDATGVGDELGGRLKERYGSRINAIWFDKYKKEKALLGFVSLCEQRKYAISIDQTLFAELHSIKTKTTKTGLSYETERNSEGHGDRAWATIYSTIGLSPSFQQYRDPQIASIRYG